MNILKFLVLLLVYDVYLQGINSLNAGAFVSLISDFSKNDTNLVITSMID